MKTADNFSGWYDNHLTVEQHFGLQSSRYPQRKSTIRRKGEYLTERLFYVESGNTVFIPDNKGSEPIYASKGDIVYLPPDATYQSEWEDLSLLKTKTLHFLLKCGGEPFQLSDKMFIIIKDKHELYSKLFQSYVNYFYSGRPGYKIKCQSILLDILYLLSISLTSTTYKKNIPNVGPGVLFIENNYLNEINMDELADLCSLCPSSFRKHFKEAVGMSPVEYKNYLKMTKAAEILQTNTYNISETAQSVNIDDVYYFSKMFKKYFGESPKAFQKKFLTENN